MKLFECQNCGYLVHFENTQCERCGFPLGFLPDVAILTALKANGSGGYTPLSDPARSVSYCANFEHAACNWLVDAGWGPVCPACVLNRTIPDIKQPENLRRWQRIEVAKHRLVYSLLRLGLPVANKSRTTARNRNRVRFHGAAPGEDGQGKYLTGHDHGEITLNVVEAGRRRRPRFARKCTSLHRTLLGISGTKSRTTTSSALSKPAGVRPFPKSLRRRDTGLR